MTKQEILDILNTVHQVVTLNDEIFTKETLDKLEEIVTIIIESKLLPLNNLRLVESFLKAERQLIAVDFTNSLERIINAVKSHPIVMSLLLSFVK